MGRPKGSVKAIDIDQVENLASIGCTQEEIAVVLKVSSRTLQRRKDAHEAIERGMHRLRTSLRRWQYEKAKDGNVAMLIWLGKQLLGQRDRIDETWRDDTIIIEPIHRSGSGA